jgi:hypothetical protein
MFSDVMAIIGKGYISTQIALHLGTILNFVLMVVKMECACQKA